MLESKHAMVELLNQMQVLTDMINNIKRDNS